MNATAVADYISDWMRDYATRSRVKGFVVGISGGIDSAVTSALAARTGLPVLCLEMPIHQAPSQVQRGVEHIADLQARYANVKRETVDLTPTFETLITALPAADGASRDMSLVNSRARLRMTTLYYFAGLHGYIVAGTGNKVEDFGVGFYTKYGDGGVDISPIADLYKTQVYALGAALGIRKSIMDAAPTDGLWGDDRTDEDQIGASYPELEWAMEHIRNGGSEARLTARQHEVLAIYRRLNQANQHKMEPIPVCLIPADLLA
jgi:NAD+ synthase